MNKPQDPKAAQTVKTTSAPAVDVPRLVRKYPWLRIESQYGENIACGGIFPSNEIYEGQRWQGSSGIVVTVTALRDIEDAGTVIDREIHYSWMQGETPMSHDKLAFAFQCRYCLILPNTKDMPPAGSA